VLVQTVLLARPLLLLLRLLMLWWVWQI